jgi:hypothetical protein
VIVACLGEFRKQIDTAGVGFLVIGEAEALDFLHLGGSLVGLVESKESNGVDALVEADALGKEDNRVLP